jgi:hypothetical protein
VRISEGVATEFVLRNLADQSLADYLSAEPLQPFVDLVRTGKEIAAAQQYQQVTGADLPEAHLAVQIARRYLA